jgi:hypothetical protein
MDEIEELKALARKTWRDVVDVDVSPGAAKAGIGYTEVDARGYRMSVFKRGGRIALVTANSLEELRSKLLKEQVQNEGNNGV